jgi:putative tryptophan/tyrosine transport system substrate-binding protein
MVTPGLHFALSRVRRFGLALLALVCAAPALARDIAIVTSREQGAEREVAEALLASGRRHPLFFAGSTERGLQPGALKDSGLVIALGVNAAQALVQGDRPVLVALVTASDFERLRASAPRAQLSGLFLDQPASRHLALIRAALPQAGCAGRGGSKPLPNRSA